ncbi:MAG: glycerol acyltransferase [Saprospiraceae bacterium]|nr:1-acyl-sn-glycerol-3-phosphate acyltransferase [Bacteroidia bacterium]NNE15520.1 glycerol acyltransferase [Saprospiraceae bacterium]NNL90629.1 glycerol acyltransferase [Saprospiraceae bacterium]
MERSKQKTQILDHIIPEIEDWPITRFSDDRDAFIERLIDFTYDRLSKSGHSHLDLLNKTVYLERQRVKNMPWKVDPPDEKPYWNSVTKEVDATKNSEEPELEQKKILRRIIFRYSEEIVGFFIPKTFKFSRKFLTAFYKRLFNNGWGRGHKGIWGSKEEVQNKVKIDGYLKEIRSLFKKGTVVIVPTHYSNLDSIMLGYAIDSNIGIPAFAYGAGLNLLDYEVMAYFINRLGAYRVDRRKKNPIYLETLKSMASLSLIEGINHIFFPGGTRSRSGAIEDKLKLGLLNSVIDAQRYCILNNKPQKIFVIPVTLGYHFVLEASSLIDQHLRATGREKYIRKTKKDSIIKTIWNFLISLRRNDSEVYVTVGQPMDVLGNYVNEEGESYDDRGNPIDLTKYFSKEDVPNADTQRESVYTKILATKIVDSFKKENMILSSHMCAYAAFKLIESKNPELDLFDILKIPLKEVKIKKEELAEKINSILISLKGKPNVKLASIFDEDIPNIINDGVYHLGIYHKKKVLVDQNNGYISVSDLKLLYFYHNKMIHYNYLLNNGE